MASSSSGRNPGKHPSDVPPGPDPPDDGGDCPECGRHFGSRRSLFSHMRSHPDRDWSDAAPPPPAELPLLPDRDESEAHAADSLVLLSESTAAPAPPALPAGPPDQFVCTGCSRGFDSFQALGGHRASHHNVRGCFAESRAEALAALAAPEGVRSDLTLGMPEHPRSGNDYRCSVCRKTFPTGQALGGHMRWHLDRDPRPAPAPGGPTSAAAAAPPASSPALERWLHGRARGQVTATAQQLPLAFRPGWGGRPPPRFAPPPPPPPPPPRAPGARPPWHAGASSSSVLIPRPRLFPYSPDLQAPSLPAPTATPATTVAAAVTTAVAVAAPAWRGAHRPMAASREARRGFIRNAQEGGGDGGGGGGDGDGGNDGREPELDLNLRLGR